MLAWQKKMTASERDAWRRKIGRGNKEAWEAKRGGQSHDHTNGNGTHYGRGNTTRVMLAIRKLDADIEALQSKRKILVVSDALSKEILQ